MPLKTAIKYLPPLHEISAKKKIIIADKTPKRVVIDINQSHVHAYATKSVIKSEKFAGRNVPSGNPLATKFIVHASTDSIAVNIISEEFTYSDKTEPRKS